MIRRVNGVPVESLNMLPPSIVYLDCSNCNLVNLDKVDLRPDDIVCFVLWRDYFIESLRKAQQIGCKIVVGIEALADPTVTHADVAVGSLSDFEKEENLEKHLNRFEIDEKIKNFILKPRIQ